MIVLELEKHSLCKAPTYILCLITGRKTESLKLSLKNKTVNEDTLMNLKVLAERKLPIKIPTAAFVFEQTLIK